MDEDAMKHQIPASPITDNNADPNLKGAHVTKCSSAGGQLRHGEAAILDSVGQIIDILRTGDLDTVSPSEETLPLTEHAGRNRRGSDNDSGIFASIGAPVVRDSSENNESGYVNKVYSDLNESSDISCSKGQVKTSQQYDSDSTSTSEEEEEPMGSGVMLPRQEQPRQQSTLQNCNNVQVGNKVEISGALTVNTVLNVVSPTSEANVLTPPGVAKEPLPPESLLKRRPPWLLAGGAFFLLMLAVVIVTLAIVIPRKVTEAEFPSRPPVILPDEEPDPNSTLPGGHRIFSKRHWGGDPPRARRLLAHPTPFVVISDTVSQECFTYVECARLVRIFQSVHITDNNLDDIGYNFLVGGDGNIYEGRGWDTTSMHRGFMRNCNIALSFIGKFITQAPTKRQLNAAIEFLERGVQMGMIAEDYKLIGLRQATTLLSPGPVLFNEIKTWPHFWEETRDEAGKCPKKISSNSTVLEEVNT